MQFTKDIPKKYTVNDIYAIIDKIQSNGQYCIMGYSSTSQAARLFKYGKLTTSHNAISKNTQSKSYTLSLTECVWEFRNNALWDTHQHAH